MHTAIRSSSNTKIKYVRSLARHEVRQQERRFVIEGMRLVDESLRAGILPALVLYTPSFRARAAGGEFIQRLEAAGVSCEPVEERILTQLSDTVTPQGIVAVVPFPEPHIPPRLTLALIADGISTPGNLGTLLRSAEAAGVEIVLLTPGTTDPFAPKVVRGAMGAHFRLPIVVVRHVHELRGWLKGLRPYVAEVKASLPYDLVDWTLPSALIVGNEAHGVSDALATLEAVPVAIPMRGRTESLNVGVAGSVILFEAARQRRRK